jgi:RNA polymerase sigma factor (sigma-70 family)
MDQVAAVDRAAYEKHRDYVLAVLRRRCGWLAEDEREAILHDAFVVLLEKERDGELDPAAMHGNQVRAYLTQTALYKALDEGKRAERNRSAPLDEAGEVEGDGQRPPEDAIAAALDGARVREIVDGLPKRRQAIIKLRFFFERTPGEIQELLGVTNRVYRRELERAVTQIADGYELVREGTFCDSRRSLILAYVAGIAGPGRAREARAHLETCPACAAWASELRETTRRAAVLLPLPALVGGHVGRLGSLAMRVKEHVSALVGGARHQGAVAAARTDPNAGGVLAGTRPGAVVATLASCVALGGGAYCAVQGVPSSLTGLISGIHLEAGAESSAATHPKPHKPARVVVPPSEPEVVTTPEPEPTPEPEAQPRHEHRAKAKAEQESTPPSRHGEGKLAESAAAAEEEFGPEGTAATASEAEATASSTESSAAYPAPTNAPAPSAESAAAATEEFGP